MTTQNNKTNDIASFIEEVSGDSHLRIESDLGDGFVRLKSSEAEKRQAAQDIRCTEDIVIEMLRNSRDANASRIYIALQRDEAKRTITIIDNGDGIPRSQHCAIFEPRVTSKLDTAHMDKWGMHGRGMALYSIAVNSSDARVVASESSLGSSIQIQTNLEQLSEKSDQSTFPSFEVQDSGAFAMRGPKNVLRIAAEFALEHRKICSVWVGSPAEIAATMYSHGVELIDAKERIFSDDLSAVPYTQRLCYAFESDAFSRLAQSVGLEISSRTAHRILNGEITPLSSLLERLQLESMRSLKPGKAKTAKEAGQARPLKLTDSEINHLKQCSLHAFDLIADAHYLTSSVEPSVRVSKEALIITIPLVREEDAQA